MKKIEIAKKSYINNKLNELTQKSRQTVSKINNLYEKPIKDINKIIELQKLKDLASASGNNASPQNIDDLREIVFKCNKGNLCVSSSGNSMENSPKKVIFMSLKQMKPIDQVYENYKKSLTNQENPVRDTNNKRKPGPVRGNAQAKAVNARKKAEKARKVANEARQKLTQTQNKKQKTAEANPTRPSKNQRKKGQPGSRSLAFVKTDVKQEKQPAQAAQAAQAAQKLRQVNQGRWAEPLKSNVKKMKGENRKYPNLQVENLNYKDVNNT